MSLGEKIRQTMAAATFAQAGEFESALDFLDEDETTDHE